MMEVELEMTTDLTDVSEILPKVMELVNAAKAQGFTVKEVEVEEEEQEEEAGASS